MECQPYLFTRVERAVEVIKDSERGGETFFVDRFKFNVSKQVKNGSMY